MPQIVRPSAPSGPATITERYDALVASGIIERDPAQEGVVAVLDALGHRARTDFRLEKREAEGGWYTPADANAKAELDRVFARLTDNTPPEPLTLPVVGRTIRVPLQARGVARFNFRDLCLAPMAAVDYIAIAQRFHILIIEGLPVRFSHRNHVKRFCSLGPPPDPSDTFPESFESRRAMSRLIEMRSRHYLGRRREVRCPH